MQLNAHVVETPFYGSHLSFYFCPFVSLNFPLSNLLSSPTRFPLSNLLSFPTRFPPSNLLFSPTRFPLFNLLLYLLPAFLCPISSFSPTSKPLPNLLLYLLLASLCPISSFTSYPLSSDPSPFCLPVFPSSVFTSKTTSPLLLFHPIQRSIFLPLSSIYLILCSLNVWSPFFLFFPYRMTSTNSNLFPNQQPQHFFFILFSSYPVVPIFSFPFPLPADFHLFFPLLSNQSPPIFFSFAFTNMAFNRSLQLTSYLWRPIPFFLFLSN